MDNLNEIIDAILLNNPTAVADRMYELGITQGDVYDPMQLKAVLVNVQDGLSEAGPAFLEYVLDVPVNTAGYAADTLIGYHLTAGNRTLIRALTQQCDAPMVADCGCGTSFSQPFSLLTSNGFWYKSLGFLGITFLVLGIIYLIRKL